MDATAPDPIAEQPEELSLKYFESFPKNFSSQILSNLGSNSFFGFLFAKRNRVPNARDMLLIASVVISASDQKITTLEAEKVQLQKDASTIRTILGNPVFSTRELPAAQTASESEIPGATDAATIGEERKWIVRYLTLGNVMGAIVIILGMLGGTLTYFTQNYKDRFERAEGSATFWENQATSFKRAAENAQAAQKTAEQNTQKQRETGDKSVADVTARLSQSQTLSANLSDQVKQSNKKFDDLQKTCPPK